MSLELYGMGEGEQLACHRLPVGVVALDLDEPEKGDTSLLAVKDFAVQISRAHGLGLYWLYQTLHGFHVIYQCQLACHYDALRIMTDASRQQGWHECGGHLDLVAEDDAVELRVGCKSDREFDIEPVPGNPPASICPHVAEHEALLARRLPAEVAA
jgi:hypothetical protein